MHVIHNRAGVLLALAVITVSTAPSLAFARELSFDDRVAAQKAIEQVYWSHRSWPKDNPGPKPALSQVMSDDAIRAKVEDYLKKSNALESLWERPITADQLQAEMNRMATNTRDADMLREIFTALGNDPSLIGETLARQALAERLLRNWYARHDWFHGELRRRAETALRTVRAASQLRSMGTAYKETTWRLRSADALLLDDNPTEIALDDVEWTHHLHRLEEAFGVERETDLDLLPLMTVSRLQENDEEFLVTAILRKGPGAITTATASWPKKRFEKWWAEQSATTSSHLVAPSGPLSAVAVTTAPCVSNTWTATPAPPDSSWATAVWTGSELIVLGGSGDHNSGRYNPSTDTWAAMSTLGAPSSTFSGVLLVWTGSEMIVWGGVDGNGVSVGGRRYNPLTDTWTAASTVGAPTAGSAAAVWTGSEMIVWGGPGSNNTGGRYNPSTDTWTATSTVDAPAGRNNCTAVWTGSEMIVWGGYYNTGGRYNPSTDTWTATSTIGAPTARGSSTAVWTGNHMIVWGGSDGVSDFTSLNTGGIYNPINDTWTATSTSGAPIGRTYHTAVWTGNEMIVWGGSESSSYGLPLLNTGGRYNPSSDSWVQTATTGAPAARRRHDAFWTGSEMLVWGGEYVTGWPANTGGRYDPSADTWVATSGGAPTVRLDHTAVWTGSEMIVWGGSYNDGSAHYQDTGGRYNPATDDWQATSTIGAPTARTQHTAIWTGSEMIVWGGVGDNMRFETGGRYNPSTGTWVATSTSGAPSARYLHTAVWTGDEMIVWGGSSSVGLTNTGGAYNPSLDTWVPTATTNAPTQRFRQIAVWTGSEMIVWGGFRSGGLSTGGRYNPSTETWVATSMTGVPSARYLHTAVWTGREMIVWGGFDPITGEPFGTGGRYDPSTNAWLATSTSDAPYARYSHTAVWTGNEMIVWGGSGYPSGNYQILITGARYSPSTDAWAATSITRAPVARYSHTAVWTGSRMIAWGGHSDYDYSNSGGNYCAGMCASPGIYFQDADGDGYGIPSVTVQACSQPFGYARNGWDCDDGHSATRPGAVEICNDIDDDCNELIDDAIAPPDGVSIVTIAGSGQEALVQWSSVPGATTYDVVTGSLSGLRASHGDFSTSTSACLGNSVTGSSLTDSALPPTGGGFWYLVRAEGCGGSGSYDEGSPWQAGSRDAGISIPASRAPDTVAGCTRRPTRGSRTLSEWQDRKGKS